MQSAGLAVNTFGSGVEFLASLTAHRPDCAVLAWFKPDVYKFEVLKRLAETSAGVPVVIMTGHGTPEAELFDIRGGAAAYLRKPINDPILLDHLSATIAASAATPPPVP